MIWCIIFSNNSWMQTLHLCLRAWTTVTLGWSVKYLTFPCCWFIVFTILPKYHYYTYKFSQIIYAVILFTTPFVVYLSIWMDVIFHSHRYRSKTLLDNMPVTRNHFATIYGPVSTIIIYIYVIWYTMPWSKTTLLFVQCMYL